MKSHITTLFIVAVIIAACRIPQKGYAESQAREYAKTLGLGNAKVTCVNNDTNRDGYVSCTLANRLESGSTELQTIECAYQSPEGCNYNNEGCRVPKGRLATDAQ